MKATIIREIAGAITSLALMNLAAAQTGDTGSLRTTPPEEIRSGPANEGMVFPVSGSGPSGITIREAGMALDTGHAPQFMINGRAYNFTGAKPGLLGGRLMVPVKAVAEGLGYGVRWDEPDMKLVIQIPNHPPVVLQTNKGWLSRVGRQVTAPANGPLGAGGPAFATQRGLHPGQIVLIGGQAYVPFDELAEILGVITEWNRSASLALISERTTIHRLPNIG